MHQGCRPAIKALEAFVAIVTPANERISMLSQKLDSVNFKNVFIRPDSVLEKELESLTPDVVLIYTEDNNAFLFKSIVAIKNKYNTPTLVVSRDYDEFVAVLALELGADEYLPSHVGANELRLRVLRLCKKVECGKAPQSTASISKETVDEADLADLNRSSITRDRATYYSFFTPYEFEVLLLLVASPGKALARDAISIAVRGRSTNKEDRGIDNIIARVRKKLFQLRFSKYLIKGYHSHGYIFTGDGKKFLDELEDAIRRQKQEI